MNNKYVKRLLMIMIVFVSLILVIVTSITVSEIKNDISRTYHIHDLEEYIWAFDSGDYYQMYIYTIENENLNVEDDKLKEYVLFSKYYEALINYHSAKLNNRDTSKYIGIIEDVKSKITWKHVLDKINDLNIKYEYEGV